MFIILALGRKSWEDEKIKVILSYIAILRLFLATQDAVIPSTNKKRRKKIKKGKFSHG